MFTLAPVRDDEGNVRFFAGVQVDVTVYKDKDGTEGGDATRKGVTDTGSFEREITSEDGDPNRDPNSMDMNMKNYSKMAAGNVVGRGLTLVHFSPHRGV